eukprot:TRINITY_DN8297_c0_g2_i1.p1 TRINITY_DN8297_c0_g2~~TRINITY_DN8297_c0_g2_i1.p1  ORF type:complete len:408 (-),score=79.77 TRINITY_DN8297_c0_g2_i1:177-1328(-)
MSLRATTLAAVCGLGAVSDAVKLIDLEEGSLFTKCIKISDLETKSMEDDIELVERDPVTGCCPGATEPGIKFELKSTSYTGPQIVCDFKANGEIEYDIVRDRFNGLQTCNFNNCFVMKQNLECANGGKQMINGCCAPKAVCEQDSCGFKEDCKNYARSITALNYTNGRVSHCTLFHRDYKARGNEGTRTEEDDVDTSGNTPKLLTANPRVYARCEGGFVERTTDVVAELLPTSAGEVAGCRSSSDFAFSAGLQCTGCAQDLVDLNAANWQRTERGCIAAVMDAVNANASSQLEAYPCVSIKKAGSVVTECSMHRSCGTASAATNDVKSCIFKARAQHCSSDASCGGGSDGDSYASNSLRTGNNRVGTGMLYVVAVGTVIVAMR